MELGNQTEKADKKGGEPADKRKPCDEHSNNTTPPSTPQSILNESRAGEEQQTRNEQTKWFWDRLAIILIFVYTAFSGIQVLVARDQEKRTLRAYVFVDEIYIDSLNTPNPEVSVKIKNFGQTPAYDFQAWGDMKIVDQPEPTFPPPPNEFPGRRGPLPPTKETVTFVHMDHPLSDSEWAQITSGRSALYVYGEIRYRDAFGEHRHTTFRGLVGGTAGLHGKRIAHDKDGNDAD